MELIHKDLSDKLLELSSKETRPATRFDIYLKIVSAILYHCTQNREVSHYFPRSYWEKVVSSKYNVYLNQLRENGVIEVDGNNFGKKSYSISSLYTLSVSPLVSVEYNNDKNSFFHQINKNSDISARLLKRLLNDMGQITLDYDAFKTDYSSVTAIDITDNAVNMKGLPDELYVDGKIQYPNGKTHHGYRIVDLQKKLNDYKLNAYRLGSSILLTTQDDFAQIKHSNLTRITNDFFKRLKVKDYRISRNRNTRRIYSIVTSLPNKALPYLKIDDQEVVGVDLRSSQLTLLANILHQFSKSGDAILNKFTGKQKTFLKDLYGQYLRCNESDITKFFEDVTQNDIYSVLANELLISRSQAKLFTFSIFFSKSDSHSILKARIREKYPTIFKIIDGYKDLKEEKKRYVKDKAYGKFASNLQAVEAYIFIDIIFNRLHKNKIHAVTRHDSVLVAKSNVEPTLRIMEGVMKELGIISEFKIEEYERINNDKNNTMNFIPDHLNKSIEEYDTQDLLEILDIGKGERLIKENHYDRIQSRLIELQKNDLPLHPADEEQIMFIHSLLIKVI